MPTYDYACNGCGGFDALRSLAQRNEPADCPACGGASPRVFATAPRLALMEGRHPHRDGNQRTGQARAEKLARLRAFETPGGLRVLFVVSEAGRDGDRGQREQGVPEPGGPG